jgi:hypothetical protein
VLKGEVGFGEGVGRVGWMLGYGLIWQSVCSIDGVLVQAVNVNGMYTVDLGDPQIQSDNPSTLYTHFPPSPCQP